MLEAGMPAVTRRPPQAWKLAAVLGFTVGCLLWFLWGIDPEVVRVSLEGIRWIYISGAVLAYLAVHGFRSLRLAALVGHGLRPGGAFVVNCIGYLAINVVPLRLGEFVRPYLLLEQHEVPLGASVAGIFVERLLDLASLVIMLLLVTWAVDLPAGGVVVGDGDVDIVRAGQLAAGAVVAVGAAGLAVVTLGGRGLVSLVRRSLGWVPGIGRALPGFVETFQAGARDLASRPKRAAWVLLNTAAMWTAQVLGCWSSLRAFEGLPHGLDAALTSWAVTLSGMTVMPTPGFFGSFEAFCVAGLLLFQAPVDLARTYAVVHHLTLFGFTVGIGLIVLIREGLSLSGLIRASREIAGGG